MVRTLVFRIALLATPMFASVATAQSASELLEKGIYQEETAGNLDQAIETYRKIVADAKDVESVAAQAQYRLAMCLRKQGKKENAIAAFRELVDRFPGQKELVTAAKKELPEDLKLLAPPWKTGERLTMVMSMPNGDPVGIVGTAVDSDTLDGKEVWRMTVRRFIAGAQNDGLCEMMIDQSTNRPITTRWKHSVLGNTTTSWTDTELSITKPGVSGQADVTSVVPQTAPSYANDQWFFGFRQLPLEIGYSTSIPIRVDFTGGNLIDLELSVKKKESVETPAGKFDCFRMETNIQQTFWISDTPERYPVKFEAGGVTATLQSTSGGSAETLQSQLPPLSVDAPQGWFNYEAASNNPSDSIIYQLVAPESLAVQVAVFKKSQLEADERDNPQLRTKNAIERFRGSIKNTTLQNEQPQSLEVAGQPGLTFTASHPVFDETFVHQLLLTTEGDWAMRVHVVGSETEFKSQQALIEKILASIRMQ